MGPKDGKEHLLSSRLRQLRLRAKKAGVPCDPTLVEMRRVVDEVQECLLCGSLTTHLGPIYPLRDGGGPMMMTNLAGWCAEHKSFLRNPYQLGLSLERLREVHLQMMGRPWWAMVKPVVRAPAGIIQDG